ncbi:TetR/AcrR family transcriptional regulator [Rhodocytophaga aerolata]|uniref:TetR/AcrR family transcriptional regulator n=1 Tax=Rhodocytophaga aerolata TaxID=455078 RepID=A0ABT8QY71_9BACT|nr:TetR/AcrR family transcriptional regulator [Rhodocytophaga aerolata]MDO1444782.1 TetR/AcrR family transcriptional regulator [Rhodocytophaga aerolata]
MHATLRIAMNDKVFVRDPEQTELGRSIISEGVRLIDELGFEQFTFKKLASEINSTEASVYRYFENKHKLLLYLTAWYWAWLDFQIDFHTNNVTDPEHKLKIIIQIITDSTRYNLDFLPVNKAALHRIVICESSKAYLTKSVDADNKEGLFKNYKALCHKVALLVLAISPGYPYAHALVSTLLEAAHQQVFFAAHLPSLTEVRVTDNDYTQMGSFLEHLVFKAIK